MALVGKVHLRNSDEKQRSGCALIGKGNKFKTCTLRPDHCLVYFAVDDTDYAFSFLIENYDADPDGDQSGDFWRYQTTDPRIDLTTTRPLAGLRSCWVVSR